MTITILTDAGQSAPPSAKADGERLWLDVDALEATTGWSLKPEGMCRGALCVPTPPDADYVAEGAVDVAGFWRRRGAPVATSAAGDIWALGEPAADRSAALAQLEAPEFDLPDLAGRRHRLSDYRGRKVLLATWASW